MYLLDKSAINTKIFQLYNLGIFSDTVFVLCSLGIILNQSDHIHFLVKNLVKFLCVYMREKKLKSYFPLFYYLWVVKMDTGTIQLLGPVEVSFLITYFLEVSICVHFSRWSLFYLTVMFLIVREKCVIWFWAFSH